jgi:hypothetical protein
VVGGGVVAIEEGGVDTGEAEDVEEEDREDTELCGTSTHKHHIAHSHKHTCAS